MFIMPQIDRNHYVMDRNLEIMENTSTWQPLLLRSLIWNGLAKKNISNHFETAHAVLCWFLMLVSRD